MIVSKSNSSFNSEDMTMDREATRAVLDAMLAKSFDASLMPQRKLDRVETARFIAEQARKIRLAAIAADHLSILWMIECLYYEAYSLGQTRGGQPSRHRAERGPAN